MQEIYIARVGSSLELSKAEDGPEKDSEFVQVLKEDRFLEYLPVSSGGDPDLLYSTVYKKAGSPGGFVVVFSEDGNPLFGYVAYTNLALTESAAHAFDLVAKVRYGVDIFEAKIEGEE